YSLPRHSTLMPASLMTLPHFASSVLIVAANSSGVLPTGSTPELKNFCFNSGWCTMRTISWLRRVTIGAGVLAGTNKPVPPVASYPGSDAPIGGTPDASDDGCAQVTPSARSRPDLMCGSAVVVLANVICTSPLNVALRLPEPPLYGM